MRLHHARAAVRQHLDQKLVLYCESQLLVNHARPVHALAAFPNLWGDMDWRPIGAALPARCPTLTRAVILKQLHKGAARE